MSTDRVFNRITAVNKDDEVIGYYDLFEALEKEFIRRVVCIYVFSGTGKLLLQKRADWVLAPNLLEQSASGHVDEGSDYRESAETELREELGLTLDLVEVGTSLPSPGFFNGIYKAVISEDTEIPFNTDEVGGVRWIEIADLEKEIENSPEIFSVPFMNIWKLYRDKILAA